jgi:hypothetical protein
MIILLSIISGIFYRMGGSDKYDTKWRDWGCPLVVLLALHWHWSLILCFLLMWGALTTYWKVLNKFFNKPTSDAYWFNWLAHGLGIGLALIPYTLFVGGWELGLVRSLALGLLMMVWSLLNDNVVWEEFGRGALIILTLWIL